MKKGASACVLRWQLKMIYVVCAKQAFIKQYVIII